MTRDLPTIAIVGRPNVGKSAIFNRLAGRRISIVHDEPGVTRDRIASECTKGARPFRMIDTGGIGEGFDGAFSQQIEIEAAVAIETADLIVFVVDAKDGLTPADRALAETLRRSGVPVLLAVNKVDTSKKEDGAVAEFSPLGFGDAAAISAAHGLGFAGFLGDITDRLPGAADDQPGDSEQEGNSEEESVPAHKSPLKLALVGRPNVGKSSLVNAILGDARTIVSDVAGTTRDAIDIPYERGGQRYLLIDTAGMRQRTRRDSAVEIFSAMRSERSIRRADLCAIAVDAAAGATKQDRRIARMVLEARKPCIIIANKFDLYHPGAPLKDRLAVLREELEEGLFFVPYAPVVATSAKEGAFINKIFGAIERVRKAAAEPVTTGALNRMLQMALNRNPPPARGGKRFKLLYATAAKTDENDPRVVPVPRFVLFCNDASLITEPYLRYIENQIRAEHPFVGLPIRFDLRDRAPKAKP